MASINHHEDNEKKLSLQIDDVTSRHCSWVVANTDPANTALVRKLGMIIMLSLFIMYLLNRSDQNAIANALLNVLPTDPALNYTGLVSIRFFMGFSETYAGNTFAVSLSGLIAAAVFARPDNKLEIYGWQWLFMIEGVVTLFIQSRPSIHVLIRFEVSLISQINQYYHSRSYRATLASRICVDISSGQSNDEIWHITMIRGIAVFASSSCVPSAPIITRPFTNLLLGVHSVNPVILGWVSGALGQMTEKKTVSLSVLNTTRRLLGMDDVNAFYAY
ncbi:hypothetical protein EJ02DRAFT_443716 [Clathrospora elynae]|uniref:MFS general substrate transporter n=1 Tax=Clathrospora elynae TaxID=706981 RepID=A0A6A5SS61_9PLEO|nr:hypothetical protein EJ02DRAFT_443716 [Clathrospora elynae]